MLPLRPVRVLITLIACLLPVATALSSPALAEVEYMVKWIPGDQSADGYRVHYGNQPGPYPNTEDFGYVAPDADGVSRRPIMIDETEDHYLAMDAYNESGASQLSNVIHVPASACDPGSCDDGNVCTIEGCSGETCTSNPVPDGTLCGPSNDICLSGSCASVECLGAEDCGQPTQCTAPTCESNLCDTVNLPNGTPCNDGDPFTSDDRCSSGACAGSPPDPRCGDGTRDAGEDCDDGNNASGDGCSATCRLEICGDGIRDPQEDCDDGNQTPGDGCRSDCTRELCGDAVLDPQEDCDDGNQTSGDGCSPTCTVEVDPSCGNGTREAGEDCDDGNRVGGDGCSATCLLEVCGDGITQPSRGEECDDGNRSHGDGCRTDCTAEACGDGIRDPQEHCDDGNVIGGDGCRGDCTREICGDGFRDPNEQCDDGNFLRGDGCRGDCTLEVCGDGIRDPQEQCDDENLEPGDGCSPSCMVEASPFCGDGVVGQGEQCDDGNTRAGDGCSPLCALEIDPSCGNGTIDLGEACDDGNTASGDGCDANCTTTACGNGVITAGEECDDGNTAAGDGCGLECLFELEPQTAAQRRCINAVNKGVRRVARAQGRANQRCLAAWFAGREDRLGPPPATFESCMAADTQGKVAAAQERLAVREGERCEVDELPTLALGSDRLTGSGPASARSVESMADLFGSPAALAPADDGPAVRCQKLVARRTTRVFDAFWSTAASAKAHKLRGRETDPARTDDELSDYITLALEESTGLERAASRLLRTTEKSCGELPNPPNSFPGCQAADLPGIAACAEQSARCRACRVLEASDPLLTVDCDRLDDGAVNASCQP